MDPTKSTADEVLASDSALVESVIAGNKAAFAELVRRYERLALAASLGVLRDRHLAQDAVQETFLQAYKHLADLKDHSRFGSWVLTIARRQAVLLHRRQQRVGVSLEREESAPVAREEEVLDSEMNSLLEAVNRLPQHEFVAVVLHYFQGYKVESIGRMIGRTGGTVSKQLTRARNKLKQWLLENE